MSEPRWLTMARRDLGVIETPGKGTTPAIRRWLIQLGAWWRDDETPWCGVALAHWLQDVDVTIPKHYYRARAWLDWGTTLTAPTLGCIVVFERGGGGHVGLVVGRTSVFDDLLVLGGNQGNRVSIAAFQRERVLGYRWPLEPQPDQVQEALLPIRAETLPISTNEA